MCDTSGDLFSEEELRQALNRLGYVQLHAAKITENIRMNREYWTQGAVVRDAKGTVWQYDGPSDSAYPWLKTGSASRFANSGPARPLTLLTPEG